MQLSIVMDAAYDWGSAVGGLKMQSIRIAADSWSGRGGRSDRDVNNIYTLVR